MNASTVLLVDEDRDSLTIYAMILEHHGFRVYRAGSAEEGLRLAQHLLPDVVVTELLEDHEGKRSLPVRLKEDPRTAHLPVVVVTTLPTGDQRLLTELAACDCYLSKPCVPTRILTEVLRLVAPHPLAF